MHRTIRFMLLGLFILPALAAQSFNYPSFPNTNDFTLNANAALSGTALRVTPSALSQKGAIYFNSPMSVVYGFETTFTFKITTLGAGGGDGFTFIVHNDPRGTAALGNHAGVLGYGAFATSPAGTAIANSLVVEFDTFQTATAANLPVNDPSGNEVSVHTGGTGDNGPFESLTLSRVAASTSTSNMSNGAVHTAKIRYVPGTLTIWLDNMTTPVLTTPYDFNLGGTYLGGAPAGGLSLIGGEYAWIGFTGSTGAAYENHDVLSWTFDSPLPGPAWTGSVGVGQGGPFNVLKISGSTGGLVRRVSTPMNQPFSIDVDQPSTNTVFGSGFYLAMYVGIAGPADSFTLPFGIGDMAIPIPYPASTPPYYVLAESFGFGNGLTGATPAPWSAVLAAGLPVQFQATIQGIIEETPGVLRTTNAIILEVF